MAEIDSGVTQEVQVLAFPQNRYVGRKNRYQPFAYHDPAASVHHFKSLGLTLVAKRCRNQKMGVGLAFAGPARFDRKLGAHIAYERAAMAELEIIRRHQSNKWFQSEESEIRTVIKALREADNDTEDSHVEIFLTPEGVTVHRMTSPSAANVISMEEKGTE